MENAITLDFYDLHIASLYICIYRERDLLLLRERLVDVVKKEYLLTDYKQYMCMWMHLYTGALQWWTLTLGASL